MSSAIFQMASSLILIVVVRCRIWNRITRIAGPEQKAEARKRGARMAEFQNGRAARPL